MSEPYHVFLNGASIGTYPTRKEAEANLRPNAYVVSPAVYEAHLCYKRWQEWKANQIIIVEKAKRYRFEKNTDGIPF
jgi:hypothetical protein